MAAGGALRFVRGGTLDDPAAVAPDVHIYTRSKLPWVRLPDSVPAFEAYYDPKALWPAASLERVRRSGDQSRVPEADHVSAAAISIRGTHAQSQLDRVVPRHFLAGASLRATSIGQRREVSVSRSSRLAHSEGSHAALLPGGEDDLPGACP